MTAEAGFMKTAPAAFTIVRKARRLAGTARARKGLKEKKRKEKASRPSAARSGRVASAASLQGVAASAGGLRARPRLRQRGEAAEAAYHSGWQLQSRPAEAAILHQRVLCIACSRPGRGYRFEAVVADAQGQLAGTLPILMSPTPYMPASASVSRTQITCSPSPR